MAFVHRWSAGVVTLAAAITLAAPASAQQRPSLDPGFTPPTVSMPVLAPSGPFAWVMDAEAAAAPTLAPVPAMSERQSVALMIVGGSALVVGSIIDGDSGTLFMVGGGAVGLIGLYQYLR